ncbi:uncharacterized protein LACBIDRAFT_335945 [Laccaria bicolor S238N-H82]|uniref:Predicted protein n=1 Tax=Laccaria bicolor (strain S238N-H82 / ATCC MYA-4686) TaxID=486041 RepID=B0DQS4_LACBS|nr:uncharacterized protein LACBIDRAFT_331855 [Laccaria bicolor S238N-H82]XP_001890889.1 uncharacterized protein LACBIDRAFT_335945 [Laccaria bicolor S238N-H82]EDQ98461.1 predicted protein [Laccaria bicolor S238N-H82]EDR03083.1 predicted protein [Laccaria bicolor S238N-H82]|eukprot:XP_001886224.1 predicted protein [Laccaria bicolor S238N-H82]
MRWSLLSLVALLALLIADVTALPMPQDGSSDLVLERRAATKPKKATKAKLSALKLLRASTFKKSSSTYRNAALKSKNHMFSVGRKSGRITKTKPPKKMPKGWDAGANYEACRSEGRALQNVGSASALLDYALQRSSPSSSLAPALKAIKDRINHPDNMAFLDPATNKAKGKAHTAVQSGKTPANDRNVADYLKHTSDAGKATAADVDQILKTHGITGINVSKEHKKVLKAHGVKRREYSDVDLD